MNRYFILLLDHSFPMSVLPQLSNLPISKLAGGEHCDFSHLNKNDDTQTCQQAWQQQPVRSSDAPFHCSSLIFLEAHREQSDRGRGIRHKTSDRGHILGERASFLSRVAPMIMSNHRLIWGGEQAAQMDVSFCSSIVHSP